jgi:hypothetical protein
MVAAPRSLEYTAPGDRYYNYCWWNYAPVAETANKLRPVNLLLNSFDVAGMPDRATEVVDTLRQSLGSFRTVWGVKRIANRFAWEFYFYDYKRRERDVSIARVSQALRPLIRCDIPINERLPYFMFSLDMDAATLARGETDVIHMYMGNPGSTVSSGVAYGLRRDSTTLENYYFFFDARRQIDEAAAKIYCSPYADATRITIDQLLWPQLRNCTTICVANKRQNDTIYFSGVNVDQLLFFLKTLQYPKETIAFVEEYRPKLDHLLYDVGFDYVTEGSSVRVLKSGYYGVF